MLGNAFTVLSLLSRSSHLLFIASSACLQASLCDAAGCSLDTGFQFSSELARLCAEMSSNVHVSEMEIAESLKATKLDDSSSDSAKFFHSSYSERKSKLEYEARLLTVVSILTKSMNLAEYFCLGELPLSTSTEHYALNMQFYTHFTSPIRRYADVLVHRQLAAVLAESARKSGDRKCSVIIFTLLRKPQRQFYPCSLKDVFTRTPDIRSANKT